MKQITERAEQIQKVEEFLKNYGHLYDPRELEYIRRNWQNSLNSKFNMDIIRQVHSELGLVSETDNIYCGFMKILEEHFGYDRDIIEVGGGRIPSLAKLIALKQKTGTITVYDPRLITTDSKIPNMTLKREYFTLDSPVDNNQLVMAFMPCDATEKALTAAAKNNADFLIGLCEGGPHGDEFDYFEDEEEWLGNILYTAKRLVEQHNLGDLVVTDLKEFDDPYPVIYNKRKNSKK